MPVENVRSVAVVARKTAYGEADWIVTLLVRDLGKVSALARSARRSRRRFAGALELFVVSQVELKPHKSELFTLSAADMIETFPELSSDVARLSHASYGTELVREFSPADQPEPELFDLLLDLYRVIAARGARVDVLRAFELGVLAHVGLAPQLVACAACGRGDAFALDRGGVLDPGRGGVVCSACAVNSRGAGVRPLSASARAVLAAAQEATQHALGDVDFALGEAAAEARDAVLALISHHLGRPLRTVEFISKMSSK